MDGTAIEIFSIDEDHLSDLVNLLANSSDDARTFQTKDADGSRSHLIDQSVVIFLVLVIFKVLLYILARGMI
jgi:hypothetical protein